ncbi:glycosyltransferase family 4 protein [Microbacterium limosum]|uniref:Glycosyltransferase family 4 protein n=1 Tax=Microbacterium limosum TaxID=3079935 RepID=A0AAU0MH86_9MICO|nr:glycosyltransferase family 4 protein [Microbacterium sp. Y20]WOQ69540.1 glycosyltransferase family 4 protein [Microbacterium sp. Y20]
MTTDAADRGRSGDGTPRRVALVCDYSLDYLGGAQSAFLDEATLLRRAGHNVLLIAPEPADAEASWLREWRGIGGADALVPARVTLPGVDLPVIRNTAGLRSRLAQHLADHGVEVVHVHSEFGLSAAAISAARRRGLRTVQTVHTFFWQAPVPRGAGRVAAAAVRIFARWLRGFPSSRAALAGAPLDSALRGLTLATGQRVDAVVSPSAHQAVRLREAGLADVRVVPNAVALPDAAAEPLTSVDAPLRIVWVGRLVPEKRLMEFVAAIAEASRRLPGGSLSVDVVGEGPLRAEGERAAEGLPVRFHGRLDRGRVQELMRQSHVVALSSYGFDNQPVTIVEALHARRGVFYVDPALTEGVDVAGLRAAGPEPEAMAEMLIALVQDPARVVLASQRAADGAREFDPEVHVARLLGVYAGRRGL